MLLSLFTVFILFVLYSHNIVKLYTSYNVFRLIAFVTYTNYILFGLKLSLYISVLMTISKYNEILPIIARMLYDRIIVTNTYKHIRDVTQKYVVTKNIKWVWIIGETIETMIKNIVIMLSSKMYISVMDNIENNLKQCSNITNTNTNINADTDIDSARLEDYMNPDEEQRELQKISAELDKLMMIGSNIITNKLNGKKDDREFASFISGFGSLLQQKKTN